MAFSATKEAAGATCTVVATQDEKMKKFPRSRMTQAEWQKEVSKESSVARAKRLFPESSIVDAGYLFIGNLPSTYVEHTFRYRSGTTDQIWHAYGASLFWRNRLINLACASRNELFLETADEMHRIIEAFTPY